MENISPAGIATTPASWRAPSQANQHAFDEAVDEIAAATAHLLAHLETHAPKKDREVEAVKARARAAKRYGAA